MSIKEFLKGIGIEQEQIEQITKELSREFIPKDQYNKKVLEISDINKELATVKDSLTVAEQYKTKHDTLEKDYNDFKTSIENEKTNSTKRQILHENLKKEGLNEQFLDLLDKDFKLDELKIKDNKIEKWENLINPLKEKYSSLFGEVKEITIPTLDPVNKGINVETDPFLEGLTNLF